MNHKIFSHLLFLFCICGLSHPLTGQNITLIKQARESIERLGISEDELRYKLAEKGIDYDDLPNLEIDEAVLVKKEIDAAILEIQEEKKLSRTKQAILKKQKSGLSKKQEINQTFDPKQPVAIKDEKGNAKDSLRLDTLSRDSVHYQSLWGMHIFRQGFPPALQKANEVKPPSSYVLGVGDEVAVSIWGQSQFNETYTVADDGYISPQRMPRIYLKGLPLSRARVVVRNYFARFYRFEPNQFSLHVNAARNINVSIFGEVKHYGSFTIPATYTAFNALMLAGGPTDIGSVRKIRLIRNGKEKILDVYKWMQNQSAEADQYLENNDIIQVPVTVRTVQITGAVQRPMRYELIEGEELKKLIEFAGGLSDNAVTKTLQVQRIEKDKIIFIDVPYADLLKNGGDFALKKGDEVTVFELKSKAEEYVSVNGAVRAEAYLKYTSGMRISDLLRKIDLDPDANLENAFLKRRNPDESINLFRINLRNILNDLKEEDLFLKPKDELTIYKQAVYKDKSYVHINGATRLPGKIELDPAGTLRVKDLVLLSGGLTTDAFNYAFLFRARSMNQRDLEVIRINIRDAMENEHSDQNIFLKAYDSLVVLSASNFSESVFVEIRGAVRKPGRYPYGLGMKLHDILSLANGFTFSAATNRIDVFRVLIKDNEATKTIVKTIQMNRNLESIASQQDVVLEPFDVVVVREQPEFELQQIITIEGEVRFPGPYALLNNNEKVTDVIARAGGLSPEAFPEGATLYRAEDSIGYIVLELDKAMKNHNSRYNLIIKNLDNIYIPKKKDLVKISGATNAADLYPDKILSSNNSISVAFHEGKNAKYYINNYAAGISKQGDPRKISVEHANGKISRTRKFLFFYNYPKVTKGATVNVGYKEIKEEKRNEDKKEVDWGKLVADTIAQATAILSLVLVIENLK